MISLAPADPHSSTTCADWGRAHDAGAEAVVLEELEAVRNEVYRAWEKPGRCVEALQYRARRLPHPHLPWFWDTVGHRLAGISARYAGRAYALARKAEQEHGLPVDAAYRQANARLFARRGALPAKELSVHQAWLAETLEPVSAHREFTAFLADWVASPGDLPADLVRRIRASTRAAGLGAASPHRPQRAGMERVDRCTHQAVQAELAASGAVVTDKRARAGRTVFVPGPWTELKASHLPLDAAKLDLLLAVDSYRKEPYGPYARLLSPLPLHELFARAWQTARPAGAAGAGGDGLTRYAIRDPLTSTGGPPAGTKWLLRPPVRSASVSRAPVAR
ncbi:MULTISPECIES: hypothetical protein [unclassified Streptomyces]|uniref:hypothetical protein n=1 Tax=unclassified Streptomyces TaxID=2593676 RepID=UPI001BE7CB93|nr:MULTISPECIES: hypothetical protein [unclassified Streptomyces]MBT2402911.1 hypothetical protein [Streptomyces sp. ISL-21]MBT2613590.1 hypothetical protein [Streptomyces sp. ISL-87]